MKKSFMKYSFASLVLLASFFFVSSGVMAQGLPNATYQGGFNYDAIAGTLVFNGLALGTITYDDGPPPSTAIPYVMDPYNDPLVKLDYTQTGGYINLGIFQQDSSNQNLFYATSGTNFSIGSVDWLGNPVATYITGDLISFEVINDDGGWHFNLNYDMDNITNVASTGQTGSEFADEFVTNSAWFDNTAELSMSFTFTGTAGFTPASLGGVDTFGSADGIVAAPEPVSSILFLSGGAVLAARRFRKIKANIIS